jgi:sterol desaturase/sphingolipid hydroxylase (fatty acid hydroxylase superfamily)
VLHGLQPFARWHAEHHLRPAALICAPTVLSASLILLLVFLPALVIGGAWPACALSFGLLTGYLAYAITHHATHHWRTDNRWLLRRKRWHARHHSASRNGGHDGVTSGFWDRVFGSG